VASLWPLDQNKGTRFQKKSLSNFLTIAGDLNPAGYTPLGFNSLPTESTYFDDVDMLLSMMTNHRHH
jgi:hypothetical protein